jgi:hypothetical protein
MEIFFSNFLFSLYTEHGSHDESDSCNYQYGSYNKRLSYFWKIETDLVLNDGEFKLKNLKKIRISNWWGGSKVAVVIFKMDVEKK